MSNMEKISIAIAEKILQEANNLGLKSVQTSKAPPYTDSTVSENFLVGLLKQATTNLGFDPAIIIHHGGHSFPDVSIKNSEIGIELKGSTSNRKFNGNSVVASTMLPNLKKIFLFYWIGSTGEIGYRDYFECVSTPVVTHSPRFQLDIDLKAGQSMFGLGQGKVGLTDKVVFGPDGIDSDLIIKWMAENAIAKGETPWWISDDDSLPTGSTGLIRCTNLPLNKRRAFMKSAFLAFPKIFDRTSPNKYNGLFEWAINVRSVLSTRDDYSAGGKVSISVPLFSKNRIEVPQVIQVAIESLAASDTVYLSELEEAHNKKFTDTDTFLKYYAKILPQFLIHIYSDVSIHDQNKMGPKEFSNALASMLLDKITSKSIIR